MHHRFVYMRLAGSCVPRIPFRNQSGASGRADVVVIAAAPEGGGQAARPEGRPRPSRDPHALVERLTDWSEAARRAGRTERADRLLLLAWEAYDRPARAVDSPGLATRPLAA